MTFREMQIPPVTWDTSFNFALRFSHVPIFVPIYVSYLLLFTLMRK
jgi:hypothetical protein